MVATVGGPGKLGVGADLFATVSSARATFDGKTPLDFDVRIYNGGPVDAPNVTLAYLPLHRRLGRPVRRRALQRMKVRRIPYNPWGKLLPVGTNCVMYGTLDPDGTLMELNEMNNPFNCGVRVGP